MDKRMIKAINDQINFEFYSSYLYLSMASFMQSMNLSGFSKWLEVQAEEELTHALKLYKFLQDRGGKVELEAISKPENRWDSILAVFESVCNHESKVTKRISDLVNLALELKDHATNAHLQWFITEQVEEESRAIEIFNQVKLAEGNPGGLFFLDKELGKRVFVKNDNNINNQ